MATTNSIVSPSLLQGVSSLQAAKPCLRTVAGRRFLILPCQDFGNGLHFSHSRHCHLDCGSPSPALAQRRLQSNTSAINSAIPRHKHRMHSKRGVVHGGFNRSRVSTSTSSESPDSTTEFPSYPNTRSRSGWRENSIHTVELPPVSLSGPHSTQFHFSSSLNRPTIIATITISFKEESAVQNTLSGREYKQNRVEPGSHGMSNMLQGESSQAPHGNNKGGNIGKRQMDAEGFVGPPNVHGRGASEEEDDWYWFSCQIEEVPALGDLPAQHVASR